MDLIVFRHGIAKDRSGELADADRPLTKEGVNRTREAARGLAKQIDPPEAVLSSPKLRARQTAELLCDALGMEPELFAPLGENDLAAMIDAIADRSESSIVIVGHEPSLSAMIEVLVGGAARGGVRLKKAGAARVVVEGRMGPKRGTLMWLATPKMLRKSG